MLGVSLVVGVVQVAFAGGLYALARAKGWAGVLLAVLPTLLAALACPMIFLSLFLWFQAIALVVVGVVCYAVRARTATYHILAAVASLALVLALGGFGCVRWAALRDEYPSESLAGRLDYERHAAADLQSHEEVLAVNSMPQATQERLTALEQGHSRPSYMASRRSEALRLVHARRVDQFVNAEGFGVGRMSRPSPSMMRYYNRAREAVADFDEASPPPSSAETADMPAAKLPAQAKAELRLGPLHEDALRDFANPDSFGYVQDVDHVAGFEPHGFTELPRIRLSDKSVRWLTVRVELVSLLKHERPMVYVSAHLPKMSELADAPVRPLDEFEAGALEKLRRGEDVVDEVNVKGLRMLGSIRAVRQCLKCHQIQRGSLLGAFSYEFQRDPPPRVEPRHPPADDPARDERPL